MDSALVAGNGRREVGVRGMDGGLLWDLVVGVEVSAAYERF
jgi:hypothetical protein